ncbi:ABC transporter ATP-binding protein [uncultured Nitratireductor sp.]|uniref:ABC transporter ATP-binding protein n=1 Tax=uncultured Nitratireductor sp. TaxID=520953 RepID=UPI0025F2671B|nr:ABC transporter ATP-binding protein [uncultured Nitratireductor sp.]
MRKSVLDIDNLSLEFPVYGGAVSAVNRVSLHVQEGEIVGIVGESGSAKSVTAMTAMRLLPRESFHIRSGRITLLGHDMLALDEQKLAAMRGRDVAMIFQEPLTALNPTKRVGAQMLGVIRLHTRLSEREARLHAIKLLTDMRINDAEEILQRYPFELSGGMRQRILIGLAFACSPKLLIADEPTTALDVTVQKQVLQLLRKKARELNTAILFICHDLAVVSQFCDRLYVMYAGSVVETGPTRAVLSAPQHPYTRALIRALPESARPGQALRSIRGVVPNLTDMPTGCAFQERCDHAFEACSSIPPLFSLDDEKRASACWLCEKEHAA